MALTQERLKELLRYEPDTGLFYWLESRGRVRKGDIAGCECRDGYVRLRVDEVMYLAHRLVWLYVHGAFPSDLLDHSNRQKADNRISNLRECTRCENALNTVSHRGATSGFKGVSMASSGRWSARISINGAHLHLGHFDLPEVAAAAYDAAALKIHGEFARINGVA